MESDILDANSFLKHIIACGLKVSNIAKLIRFENLLFDLLIEEKKCTEYLISDYKTFADVLIQETLRHDLRSLHPILSENLFGEEENVFTNKLNVKIQIKIENEEYKTKKLILQVLDGHDDLASKLASLIHSNVTSFIDEKNLQSLWQLDNLKIPVTDIALWIDPIDSTAEYINGVGLRDSLNTDIDPDKPTINSATVLIGAFFLSSGIPFAGVIYQPFSHRVGEIDWSHCLYWGITLNGVSLFSNNIKPRELILPGIAITTEREVASFTLLLNGNDQPQNWHVISRSGAGFKFLQLLSGQVNCYILSQGSTYKWDTCGPHGILLALGGGMVDYQALIDEVRTEESHSRTPLIRSMLKKHQLRCLPDNRGNCNDRGFLAYASEDLAVAVIDLLMK